MSNALPTATIAQYRTKCHECGMAIEPGDEIEPGYRSFRHADCTMASIKRQVQQRTAEGASQAEVWAWLNRSPHLTDEQRMAAIFFTR